MQRSKAFFALLVVLVLARTPAVTSTICTSFTKDNIISSQLVWYYGMQDSWSGEAPFYAYLDHWYDDLDMTVYTEQGYANVFNFWINTIPVYGAKNWTQSDISAAVPTANWTCLTDYSGIWGPAYPSARYNDFDIRSQYHNLEVHVHYSAPNQTSYIRAVLFVKNVGNAPERVRLSGDWYYNYFTADLSPLSADGRYVAPFPWFEDDLGANGDNPAANYDSYYPMSLHVRGPKARDYVGVNMDMDNYVLSPVYYTELAAGEEMALLFALATGRNQTGMLKNAAELDTEPAHLFHDLNADQLSLIRNWGACEVILAPDVEVTVTAPSQCSNGLTSDFTVSATRTRNDYTAEFTHRVVLMTGEELVSAQPSTTLQVPNGAGSVKHQLWYKACLVKETPFDACAFPAAPVAAPVTTPVASPNAAPKSKSNDASSSPLNIAVVSFVGLFGALFTSKSLSRSALVLVFVVVIALNGVQAQSTSCTDVGVGELTNPMTWYYGLKDGSGSPAYTAYLYYGYWVDNDYYVRYEGSDIGHSHYYWINGVPLLGTKNYTTAPTIDKGTPTATFTCDTDHSGLWGPAYPDYRSNNFGQRGQFQNLEVYVHYSAPNTTSYLRSILFVKNTGSKPERVRLSSSWATDNYAADVSPLNGGHYYTMYPWQNGDTGRPGFTNYQEYSGLVTSVHASGPKGRDAKKHIINAEYDDFVIGPTYWTVLEAGQEMALMYITSHGLNKSLALKNAAEINTEPAFIFHDLNADQLSMIRNWGACEVILAPDVEVTVTAPSQCSNGLTSDFTVSVTKTRNDYTSGFTHRVVSAVNGAEIVPPQSSTTLSVVNNVGPVMHQLWYKECLIKETMFNAC